MVDAYQLIPFDAWSHDRRESPKASSPSIEQIEDLNDSTDATIPASKLDLLSPKALKLAVGSADTRQLGGSISLLLRAPQHRDNMQTAVVAISELEIRCWRFVLVIVIGRIVKNAV